jgi:hypothetical protein
LVYTATQTDTDSPIYILRYITQTNIETERQVETEKDTGRYVCMYVDKAVPLQAWSGPECSRKLRFPHYMAMAQDGGKVVSLTHRPPLPLGNTPGTHFC